MISWGKVELGGREGWGVEKIDASRKDENREQPGSRQTFSSISKFHVSRLLRRPEGVEHLHAVRADAPCKREPEAETQKGSDGRVGGELIGRALEGVAV